MPVTGAHLRLAGPVGKLMWDLYNSSTVLICPYSICMHASKQVADKGIVNGLLSLAWVSIYLVQVLILTTMIYFQERLSAIKEGGDDE